MSLAGTLSRLRAVIVVALGTGAGVTVPQLGSAVAPLTTPLVAVLVFTSLRGVSVGDRSGGRTAGFVAAVLVTSYLVVPALLVGVAPSLPSPAAATALLVVVAAPTTAGSALVWTDLSGGDGYLATAGAVASLLVAPVAVPTVLATAASRGVSVPVGPIVRTLVVVVGVGGVASLAVPDDAVSDRTTDRVALLAIFLLLYASIATAGTAAVPVETVAVVAGCALAAMAGGGVVALVGVRAGRLSPPGATALLYASTLKNLGVSLAVAAALGVGRGVVVVVAFYAVQQLASGALATALGGSVEYA